MEAALHAFRPQLREIYSRLAARRGKKIARVAIAGVFLRAATTPSATRTAAEPIRWVLGEKRLDDARSLLVMPSTDGRPS